MPVHYIDHDLALGPIKIKEIAHLKTPAYLYDFDEIKQRTSDFANALNGIPHSIHYAVKANTHSDLLLFMAKLGIGADVVSGGELRAALAAGFTPDKIIFSGVAKSKEEISFALETEIVQINVESLNELRRIDEIAKRMNVSARVALRINPQVSPQTHPYIATGFKDNKFGLDTSHIGEALEIIENSVHLKLIGLAVHIGSQLLNFEALHEALELSLGLIEKFNLKDLKSFDVGGGLGIDYGKNGESDLESLTGYAKVVRKFSEKFKKTIRVEPGRYLVARSGLLLSEIQYIKKTPHKNFVILNSGMNHLIRPALYQAVHRILPLKMRQGPDIDADVVGPICESSDFLARNCRFTSLEEGDILAILDAGAYGFSMASRYNLHDWPETYVKQEGRFRHCTSKF